MSNPNKVSIILPTFNGEKYIRQSIESCLSQTHADIELLIIGEMSDRTEEEFRSDLIKRRLERKVEYIDWLPLDEALDKLIEYDLGLVLFQDGRMNHKYALPHKLFDYMGCGLAVLVPDFSEIVDQIVMTHNCGVSIDVSKPRNLAEVFDNLASDRKQLELFGKAGKSVVLVSLNWENEEQKLLLMYNELQLTIIKKKST